MNTLLTRGDVTAAHQRIAAQVHRTPVLTSRVLSKMVGRPVLFKCENLQRTGSFKIRGASHALARMSVAEQAQGVATHSSGNHGAALACAAADAGIAAHVVVPQTALAGKRAAIARYGATIVSCGPSLQEREAALAAVLDHTGAVFVPPYNHLDVIAGQGTVALELIEDAGQVTEIWVPVGGGGLASGVAACLAQTARTVVGAQPELADDAVRGLAQGQRMPACEPRTIADGLRTALGDLTFAHLQQLGVPVHSVGEAEISEAQALLMNCLKLLVEPSSAVPFAALLAHRQQLAPDAIPAVVLTGGNVDLLL